MPPATTAHAVCSHDCPDSCAVLVTVDELGSATRMQGDPDHPVTRGFLCGKVAKYLDRVYSPSRLLYPMRRRAGAPKGNMPYGREAEVFERIGWDQALDLIAERLHRIAREYGPESILPYSYAGTIGVLGYRLHGSPLLSPPRRLAAGSHYLRYRGWRCPGSRSTGKSSAPTRSISAMPSTSSPGRRIFTGTMFTSGPLLKKLVETALGW